MPNGPYLLDLTGSNPDNLVTNEIHTVTESNYRDYFFIVPIYSPFYVDNFQLIAIIDNVEEELQEGIDYNFALPYIAGIRSTGKMLYGAVTLNNINISAILKMRYQTLGGDWVVNRNHVLWVLAEKAYNPRTTIWDEVTDKPGIFPPIPHYQDYQNFYGTEELINALDRIRDELIEHRDNSSFVKHLASSGNPHNTTLSDLGYSLSLFGDVSPYSSPSLLINAPILAQHLSSIIDNINSITALLNTLHTTPRVKYNPSIYCGSEGIYEITDYNTDTTYNISSPDILLTRQENIIEYIAPDVPLTTNLSINAKTLSIQVNEIPLELITKFNPNIPVALEQFGKSISSSSDLSRIVVGCPDNNKVYVLSFNSGSASQVQVISKPDAHVMEFGKKVYISPNATNIIISAPSSNNNTGGRVYIYTLNTGVWVLTTTLKEGTTTPFGYDFYVKPDDSEIIIGHPGDELISGRVHIYSKTDDVLILEDVREGFSTGYGSSVLLTDVSLIVSDTEDGYIENIDRYMLPMDSTCILRSNINHPTTGYGSSLAVSNDGRYLAVGSIEENKVYIYDKAVRSMTAYEITGFVEDSKLGTFLTFDSSNRLYIGCVDHIKLTDPPEQQTGSVYVVERKNDKWIISYKISPSSGLNGDKFGTSICLIDHNDETYVIIGSPGSTVSGQAMAGEIYLYSHN